MGDTELFILENLKCLACKMSKKVTRQTAFYGQVWMLETKAGFLPGADFCLGAMVFWPQLKCKVELL